METARQVNRSPKTIFALTAAFGILMFALNFMTPMLVDDYTYCYSFADGKRISYLLQIIPSMENHYQTMNGKVYSRNLFLSDSLQDRRYNRFSGPTVQVPVQVPVSHHFPLPF